MKEHKEIRERVARMMGWRWDEDSIHTPEGKRYVRYTSQGKGGPVIDLWPLIVPDYPNSLYAAFQVVEHMAETYPLHSRYILITRQAAGDDPVPDNLWYVEFPFPQEAYGAADTAPLAICLAALEAVGDDG